MIWRLLVGADAENMAETLPLNCFQTGGWVKAVSAVHTTEYRYALLCGSTADTGEKSVYLPGAVRYRYGLPLFDGMPMGGYSGWVTSDGPVPCDVQRRLTRQAAVAKPWLKFSYTEDPLSADLYEGGCILGVKGEVAETHILRLTDDEDALFSGFKSNLRSDLRRSEKKGYLPHRFSGNDGAVSRFYSLYESGKSGWKVDGDNLPRCFFASLSESGNADIWLTEYEGADVAAAYFIKGHRDVFYYASGTLKGGTISPSPMEHLLWMAIRYYATQGIRQMNFGASLGLDGVRKFKEKFGAVPCAYNHWSLRIPWILRYVKGRS